MADNLLKIGYTSNQIIAMQNLVFKMYWAHALHPPLVKYQIGPEGILHLRQGTQNKIYFEN